MSETGNDPDALVTSAGSTEQARAPFSLLRWLSLTTLVSVAVISASMALVLSKFMTERLLGRDAEVGMAFVQSIAETERVTEYFTHGGARADDGVVEFFRHIAAMPDVLRANVYAPDGTLLWSSRSELIGQRFTQNRELEQALSGKVSISRHDAPDADANKPEHLLFDGQEFVEYYFPVRGPADGQIIGVVELYKAPRTLWETIAAGKRLIWSVALAGGFFLYASFIGFAVRADRMLQRQATQLFETEGLALVGEMSAAVAHNIRNPLSAIRTSAELVAEMVPDDVEARDCTNEIVRQVDRIEILLRTLLTYAHIASDGLASANPAQLVRAAAAHFSADFAERGVQLDVSVEPELPRVRGEELLIMQVLHSVIANALEATRRGDRVRVSVEWPHRGPRVELIVSDTGCGVDVHHLDQVFKPFFTTKSRGLGIGLALARRIVERLGGTIALRSNPESGTRLSVSLPAAFDRPCQNRSHALCDSDH